MTLEINDRFKECLDILLNTKENIFITGKAGSGKSTLLTLYREKIKNDNYVVLAPTGVAAVNIKGQTIHSFFQFRPDIDEKKIKSLRNIHDEVYKKLDTI